MAIVRKLEKITLDKGASHTEVDATYSIINGDDGTYLQIDTYGSKKRQEQGKKSQSIRLSPEAIKQLRTIIESEL